MEADNRLNLLNEIDLFCLHVVFLPRINRDLDSFIECWNNHSLSTEGNLTPNQLFVLTLDIHYIEMCVTLWEAIYFLVITVIPEGIVCHSQHETACIIASLF